MHLILILLAIFVATALLSVMLIWLRWREWWTPVLVHANIAEFNLEQSKLRLGETFLSREMLHPYMGYALNPVADEAAWKACGSEKLPVNSFGLLSPIDALPRRSPGKTIVAIFGGSVAQQLAVENADALKSALAQSGALDGKEIDLRCFAVPGFKQPQQLAELTYFSSLGAEFDIVINLDGFNEVALHPAENAFKGVCHSFPRAWASRSAARIDPALVFLFGQLAITQEQRRDLWKRAAHPMWRFVPQAYYVLRLWEGGLRSRRSRAMKSIRQFRPAVEENLNAALRQADNDAGQLVELWSRSSRLMDQLCRANGARYFHFLQPNQYVPDSKPLSDQERTNAFDENHPYRPGVLSGYPLLRSAGESLARDGEHFTDLTRLFVDCRDTIYADRCCHFNRKGNEMIAAAIAQAISSAG